MQSQRDCDIRVFESVAEELLTRQEPRARGPFRLSSRGCSAFFAHQPVQISKLFMILLLFHLTQDLDILQNRVQTAHHHAVTVGQNSTLRGVKQHQFQE